MQNTERNQRDRLKRRKKKTMKVLEMNRGDDTKGRLY